jgi:ankyrin repeat protein
MMKKIFSRASKVSPSSMSSEWKEEEEKNVSDEEESSAELVRLHTLLKLYGRQRHPRIDLYEVLKERDELVQWRYVPPKSTVLYISHEWVGTNHPDPDGTQMYHLLYLLERLQKGEVSRTDMDSLHSLMYKHNYTTTAEEWKQILNSAKTYIWYDGFCLPRARQGDGFRLIASYVQLCSFMIILAPGCTHFDRIDPKTKRKMNLCYRTYRLRARCVFEMFCAFLTTRGGEKPRPVLLVRSGTGIPNWVSPLECQRLAVGTSSFECCDSNHTLIQTCRRPVYLTSLVRMIETRVRSLFLSGDFAEARLSLCFTNYWCRGLLEDRTKREKKWDLIQSFKKDLRWRCPLDGEWKCRDDIPLLVYASSSDCIEVVRELLIKIHQVTNPREKRLYLCGCVPKKGLVQLGMVGGSTPLIMAMTTSQPEIVSLLLDYGAGPFETEINGSDPLMYACAVGRTENVNFWLDRFPDWDLQRKNTVLGGVALGCAVFMGPHRLELVKVLLDRGASLNYITDGGSSILIDLCSSEDADPEILQLLLEKIKKMDVVNIKIHGRTIKRRTIYRLARFLTRHNFTKSGLMTALAQDSGSTALHYAVQRGDVDVVNVLLQHGSDPIIKNDLGKSPVDYCDAFPEMKGALKRLIHMQKQRLTKHNIITLNRRNSTATDMKFPMHLVPLDQLDRLYGGKYPRHNRIEAHQELKRRGELVMWEDLPIDAHIIFLSHEWIGWNHPDPHGVQLKTFLRVMQRLQSGKISQVEMNVFHTMMYKTNRIMKADEWKEMLSTTYVWIDWASMPQPSACPSSVPKDEKKKMGKDLENAVKSIPAYVIFTHTHTKRTSYTKTREQVHRKSRFCCDRGSRMSSRGSKRSRHKTSHQDMLSNVPKSRMVCS